MARDRMVREVQILLAAAALYFGVRVVVEGSESRARANAERILDVEAALGIDVERSVQDAVVDNDLLRTIGDVSYVWLHWPLLILVFAMLLLRGDPVYYPLRNALIVSGAVGVVLFAVFPVAPPRFLPGFVGTVDESARTHYIDLPASWRNQFAAFPSFHVGWTAVACLALRSIIGDRWLRWLVMVPAVLVAVAVVSTANHYLVDAIVGLSISVVLYAFFLRRGGIGESPLAGTVPTPPVEGRGPVHAVNHGEEGNADGEAGEAV